MREQLETELGMTFQEFSKPTKMIVVADGDIARNDVDPRSMSPLPLGFNRFENYTYGNKDFLLNCVEYLLDQNGVVAARSKDFKLRLLNKVKANDEKVKWQIINIVLPLVFLAIFGLVFSYIRKRKYAK
jgi:ABC-2 type transport system permease protein